MSGIESLFNPYDRRARLYPMVLVLLPIGLAVAVWIPEEVQFQGLIGSSIVAVAIASFLTQLARDQGKRKEPELFRKWGGRPSDCALMYGTSMFSAETIGRRHRLLAKIDRKLKFPKTPEAEKESPAAFASVYAAATDLLVAKTADRTTFALLFQENMNYGFRRNLWGMRATGVATAAMGLIACIARVSLSAWNEETLSVPEIVGLAACASLLVLWLLRVTSDWVKIPADGYAKQLAMSCDRIPE